MVDDNHDLLARACTGRFMNDIASGTLELSTFRAYLAIERHFVVESARVLAATALRSPDEESLIQHVYAAHHLVHDQLRYFAETLQRVGDADPVSRAALATADGLARLAREVVASGDYWRPVVLSYATEHLYLTWCDATLPAVDPTTEVGRWVAMHTTSSFRDRVKYLAGEVDRATPDDAASQANRLYRQVIEAEIRFHEAPYADTGPQCRTDEDHEDTQHE
jgi:thiaminase/transcriptional activator TenA